MSPIRVRNVLIWGHAIGQREIVPVEKAGRGKLVSAKVVTHFAETWGSANPCIITHRPRTLEKGQFTLTKTYGMRIKCTDATAMRIMMDMIVRSGDALWEMIP